MSRARSSRRLPETYAGCRRIASATVSDRWSGWSQTVQPERQAPERPGQPGQRGREQRRAAAVDGHGGHRLTGHLGERGRDGLLERVVGLPVGREVPAVQHAGGEHGGVLARAVHQDRLAVAPGPHHDLLGGVVQRVVGRRLQRGLGDSRGREDAAYPLDVERLAGVRRAGQRQELGGQVQAEPHHRQRLERLVAGPRQDRPRHLADRPLDGAVRRERHHGAVVVPLDEPGAHDLGHDHRG